MRWLTPGANRRTRRGPREGGATAVIIVIMMIPLLGMAGYVIDVGIVRQERRELQNGADAAALALAQECVLGFCSGLSAKAEPYVDGNAFDGIGNPGAAAVTGVTVSGQTVKVDARTETTDGATSLTMQFAYLFGHATSTVTASATAAWGQPGGGTVVPLTFSFCQWNALTGGGVTYPTGTMTIFFKDDDVTNCAGPAGQNMPGGFGWLDPSAGPCKTTVISNNLVSSDPGNGNPNTNGCVPSDFLNKDVVFPVFKQYTLSGANGLYTIHGLATFRITGMRLANNGAWVTSPPPCAANKRCVVGYFLKDIIPWSGSFPGGPNLGTSFVKLTA